MAMDVNGMHQPDLSHLTSDHSGLHRFTAPVIKVTVSTTSSGRASDQAALRATSIGLSEIDHTQYLTDYLGIASNAKPITDPYAQR
jgi:hypothetical protein